MRVTALDRTEVDVTRHHDGLGPLAAAVFVALTIAAWAAALVFVLPSILFLLEILLFVLLVVPRRRRSRRAERSLSRGA